MYILAPNGTAEKYPYSIGQLRKDNPQTSFPKNPSDVILASWGVFSVAMVPQPTYDPNTQNIRELTPVLVNDVWTQVWEVSEASSEEIEQRAASLAASIRSERDRLLSETDWIVIKAYERNENIPMDWEVYRQALRDITSQAGFPYSVEWPTKP